MSKVVNFSSLKRRDIRCIIFEDGNGELKVVYKDFDKINVENPIEIYNPDKNQIGKILDVLKDSIDKETGKVDLAGETLLLKFIPMLTNIFLDTDENMIEEIVQDPSDTLLLVQDEIGKILDKIAKRIQRNVNALESMSEEQRKIYLEKYVKSTEDNSEELSEEEIAVIVKAKKLGKI